MSQTDAMSVFTNTKAISFVSLTQGDVPVYSKSRPFIIVSTFAGHFWAVPMMTHGKTGLANVGDKDEHFYVRDHHVDYATPKESDSKYNSSLTQISHEAKKSTQDNQRSISPKLYQKI